MAGSMTTNQAPLLTVAKIGFAPIKSTRMIWVDTPGARVNVTERGVEHDREFVVVGAQNMFVAQRSAAGQGIGIPQMCLIKSKIVEGALVVSAPDMTDLCVNLRPEAPIENVEVWGNASLASIYMGSEAKKWFSSFLSRYKPGEYRLFRMANNCRRQSKGGQAIVSNQDGFPFTIGSTASLDLLNRRLSASGLPPVGWDRFRPSFVIDGIIDEHIEDRLARIVINGIPFNGKTLCSRCAIVNTDQKTGTVGAEPLKTLAGYRRGINLKMPTSKVAILKLGMVFFTRNFDHLETGSVPIGAPVFVGELD